MMPLAMFVSAPFIGVWLLTFLLYGALGGFLVLLPYALIEVLGYSATGAGAVLLPVPLVISLTSPSMGRLASRVGPPSFSLAPPPPSPRQQVLGCSLEPVQHLPDIRNPAAHMASSG